MKFAASVLALAIGSLLAGCHEPHSFMVKRPDDPAADRAVTKLWTHDIARIAKDGDWILSRSYYATSDLISLATTGEDISHASIYDARTKTVIESVRSGVREIPLQQLVDRNAHLILVRPTGMTAAQRRRSVERARSRLGAEFDIGGMIGLGSDDKVYCSELVWWASEGELRTGVHETVITPNDLLKYGEVVYWSGERDDEQIQAVAIDAPR